MLKASATVSRRTFRRHARRDPSPAVLELIQTARVFVDSYQDLGARAAEVRWTAYMRLVSAVHRAEEES